MKNLPTFGDFRHLLLWALLAATLALWLVQGRATSTTNAPAPETSAKAEAPPTMPVPAGLAQPVADIFSIRTWEPPLPVTPAADTKPAPPPKPQAPPLPFRFLGQIAEPGKAVAFMLARGERVVSVSVGETINGIYFVEKHQGGRLYFVYKPLKVRQSLSVGRDS